MALELSSGTLEVHLVRAEELVVPVKRGWTSSTCPDAFVQLRVHNPANNSNDSRWQKSTIQWKCQNPVWNQKFLFSGCVPVEDELVIEVLDACRLMAHTPIGSCKFKLKEAAGSGFEQQAIPICLPVVDSTGQDTGYLRVELSYSSDFPGGPLQPSGSSAVNKPTEWGRCATLFTLTSVTRFSDVPLASRAVSDVTTYKLPASRLSPPKAKPTPANSTAADPGAALLTGKVKGLPLDQRVLTEEHSGDCWAEFDGWQLLERGDVYVMYSARHKGNGQEYCIKQFSKQPTLSSQAVCAIQQEVIVMQALSTAACPHDNIIALVDMFEDNASVCLVMELCTGSDLFEAILAHGQYTEQDAATMMRTIITTIAYMHSAGIMHRDVRPEAMAFKDLSAQAGLKFTNLGAAALFEEGEQMTEPAASLQYAAPEVLEGRYGKEADMWSCGVLLFSMLCGSMPYEGISEEDVLQAIREQPLSVSSPVWGNISDPAKDCVLRLMDPDPNSRASPAQILKHNWLAPDGCAPRKPIDKQVVSKVQDFVRFNSLKKEALKVIALSRPLDELKVLRDEFLGFDQDQSGTITQEEFIEALRRAGHNVQDMSADICGGSGMIYYDDFLAAMLDTAKLQRDEDIRRAFEHFDIDMNGKISADELKQVFADQARWGLDQPDVMNMIQLYDQDGDQEINFAEFCRMLRGA